MPIIIDNFHVRIDAPIDNRFVVGGTDSFYSNRDAIQHKYQGLRIWDLTPNNSGPYYWTGVTWSSENAVGVAVDGTTSPGYLPVFTQGPTILGKSIIYQNPAYNQIGIGLVGNAILANVPSGPSLPNGLHVAGNIRTNASFVGSGLHVTDINASNINNGLLNIARISHLSNTGTGLSSQNYVLTNFGVGSSVTWSPAIGLSVLSSTNTTNINITEEFDSTSQHYITFVNNTNGQLPLRINSSKMQFKPSNGQLFLSDGSPTEPVYSFLSSASNGVGKVGMYYNGDISFTFPSGRCFSIRPGTITIYDSNYTQIDFYKSPTDVQKLFVGQGGTLKYRTNSWDPSDIVQVASDNIVWHSGNLYTLKAIGSAINQTTEINRDINVNNSYDANGAIIKGIYNYNVYNTAISPSPQVHWSVISFGRGDEGSVQLASNWYGNNIQNGLVYADRDILLRSLRDTTDVWSPWVKIWNSGNSGYVPFGAIMMWSGSATLLPSGWRLCDGSPAVTIPAGSVPGQPSITSITIPDLRERFVVGAGNNPAIPARDTYDSFLYYHWSTNVTLTGTFNISTGGSNPNTFNIDTTRLFYINANGVGVQMTSGSLLNIGFLSIRPMIHTCTPLVAFVAFDMRINQYRMFKGTATNGTTYNTNYFTFDTLLTNGLGTWVEYNKYFENGIRFNLPEITGAETSGLATILWSDTNSYIVGETGGSDMVRISQSQLGSHRHLTVGFANNQDLSANNTITQGHSTGGNFGYGLHGSSTDATAGRTSQVGGNQPIENRPPYYALAFIIYTGI